MEGQAKFFDPRRYVVVLLLVPLVGTTTIVVNRLLLYLYEPYYFIDQNASISKAGALLDLVFMPGMTVFAVLTVIAGQVVYQMHMQRSAQLKSSGLAKKVRIVVSLAYGAIIISMIALVLLAHISVKENAFWHVVFSYCCFVSSVFCYGLEISVLFLLRTELGSAIKIRGRILYFVILVVDAIGLLFIYLTKDGALFTDLLLAQHLYAFAEYSVVILLFCYPMMLYRETKRYFGV